MNEVYQVQDDQLTDDQRWLLNERLFPYLRDLKKKAQARLLEKEAPPR